jgi:deoxyribodipyrimidine photolyase
LADVPAREIHAPNPDKYLKPIVDYTEQKAHVLAEYKKIFA